MFAHFHVWSLFLLQETTVGWDPVHLWAQMGMLAKAVVVGLFIMSAYSIGVMIDRMMAYSAAQFFRGSLGVTAGDPDGDARKFTGEAADGLAGLLVGPFGDGTGVDQVQVRNHPRGGGEPALVSQRLAQAGGVDLVDLTAEGGDAEKSVFRLPFLVFRGHCNRRYCAVSIIGRYLNMAPRGGCAT